MKIFTNKTWEYLQTMQEHELGIYKLRSLKLEYLEKLFNADFKSMNTDQIDEWYANFMTEAKMENFQLFFRQGSIAGVDAICDTFKEYDLISDAIIDGVREKLIDKINEKIKELDN